MIKLVDSHCHIDMLEGDSAADYISRAQQQGVCYFLNVCVSLREFSRNLETANQYDFVGTTVGLHPNYDDESVDEELLLKLADHDKVVGIGETGLDYFRSEGDLDWQRERFRIHIRAAKKLMKPLIIHTRAAQDDTIAIMREENASDVSGVMHCFTEDWVMAKAALDMGFYISFSGIVTFKNAHQIQDVSKRVPLDRILIETDCPYLAPMPHRGKPNEPAFVRHTAEYLSHLRGISLDDFSLNSSDNFFRLFKGAKKPYV